MLREDIENRYKVKVCKARRGFYYTRDVKGRLMMSKDYPSLEVLEKVLLEEWYDEA